MTGWSNRMPTSPITRISRPRGKKPPTACPGRFHLKEGVTFHDGTAFNAQTVADWIPDFADTENAYLVAAVDSVEVVDDLTVKFVMSRPEPNLLYNLSSTFMGVPGASLYDELGENFGVTGAVGTGPFKLDSFAIGLETVLVRNDDYAWASDLSENQGAAHLEQITFREIPDQSTAFLELKTGGVDLLLGVPTDFLEILKAESNVAVIQMPGTGINYMPINVTSAPFDDIKVRQATGLAVNQEAIVASIYNGVGAPAHNFLICVAARSAGRSGAECQPTISTRRTPCWTTPAGSWAMARSAMKDGDASVGQTLHPERHRVYLADAGHSGAACRYRDGGGDHRVRQLHHP